MSKLRTQSSDRAAPVAQAERAAEMQHASPATKVALDSESGSSPTKAEMQTTASEPAAISESGVTGDHSEDVPVENSISGSQPCPGSFASSECVICWEADASVVLQPCGHMCACPVCATLLQHSDCPMCRRRVQSCLNVQ